MTTTTDFKDIYETEFSKLNAKQKEAVETVDGPVMVIAGPGTGKTQILSRRVANILLNHDTSPEEIVCLTYTEAGASEMLDRLEKLLGERGRNVRVSTIHAFCSALILDNPDEFDNETQVISTALRYGMLKDIMDEHIQEGDILYKNSGDRYSSKGQLLDLYSRMKRQGLSKKRITHEVDKYLKAIEFSVEGDDLYKKFKYSRKYTDKKAGVVSHPGDLKPKFDEEKAKLDKLIYAAEVIDKYAKKLSDKNYFDFDDMLLWTKDLLERNSELQQSVAKGIRYLFVDEFQDTSVIQNELVDLLVQGKERPNIFVVGDDDQSIYRFQGVSATNIEDFSNKYQPVEIVLEENYRSAQIIIDAAKELICNNTNRKEKQLKAAGDNKGYHQKKPTLMEYASESAEMMGVLNNVKELIESGVTPKEIGIIYGRNNYGKKLANLFKKNNIPVYIKLEEDLFEDPFFNKLYAVLSYLNRPSRHLSELRKILYFDFFNISVDELIDIRNAKNINSIASPDVIEIDRVLEQLRKKILNSKQPLSPIYVLQQVIKAFQIDTYMMQSKEKYHLVSVLTALYELMHNEVLMTPELDLTAFLDRMIGLKEMKVNLQINHLEGSPDNCVNLMTAHGSKGLEFDYVFMVKCNDGKKANEMWPGGENHSSRFSYPPSLDGKEENETELKKQENRRLFYVGMTRAKKELYLSYIAEKRKSKFIDEIGDYILEVETKECDVADQRTPSIIVQKVSDEVRRDIASKFSLSVSTLNSFLKCPLSFYFNKVLKLPSESNEAMIFGSMVHDTLEGVYVTNQGDSQDLTPKLIASKDEAVKRFNDVFNRESWKLSSERVRKDDYARGISIIDRFYSAEGYLKPGIVALEKNISAIKLGDIKNTNVDLSTVANFEINGKIDKIEVDGDILRLIDYKTGNPKSGQKNWWSRMKNQWMEKTIGVKQRFTIF